MEARKITIVQTKNQKKSVIMSSATTLAELKRDLRDNGIDYDGMTFFEGTSKVELKTDDAVLPHDVPYKGTITNELVFMLTNTNKKIRSGAMSRAEAYAKIKALNLGELCKEKYGRNFTQVPTNDLIALIEDNTTKEAPKATKKVEKPVKEEPKKEETKEISAKENTECVDNVARAAISRLVEILEENGTIEEYEKGEVLDILGGSVSVSSTSSEEYKPKSASPYSDDEIDNMFAGMGVN